MKLRYQAIAISAAAALTFTGLVACSSHNSPACAATIPAAYNPAPAPKAPAPAPRLAAPKPAAPKENEPEPKAPAKVATAKVNPYPNGTPKVPNDKTAAPVPKVVAPTLPKTSTTYAKASIPAAKGKPAQLAPQPYVGHPGYVIYPGYTGYYLIGQYPYGYANYYGCTPRQPQSPSTSLTASPDSLPPSP